MRVVDVVVVVVGSVVAQADKRIAVIIKPIRNTQVFIITVSRRKLFSAFF